MKATFSQWMGKVESEISSIVSLTSEDLEDFGYRDAYDAGERASSVAREVLEENGFDLQTKDDNQWSESYRED